MLVGFSMGIYGLVGFYFLPLASFEGDLTRMAKLPESLFGWTMKQPSIDPDMMKSAEWNEADVLAIGDSFTYAQIWQTVLAKRGVRVRTEPWENVFRICEDFTAWVRAKGFKGKYVVIESVEKGIEERLARSVGCKHTEYHLLPMAKAETPYTFLDRKKNDYSGRVSVGIRTEMNALKYEQLSSKNDFKKWDLPGEVRIERINNGCDLFSHPRCNDVLFYEKDQKQDLGENVLVYMEKISERMPEYSIIWVIIPDKSTVYLNPNKKYWDEAERRFNAPNILRIFRQAIHEKTIDLYFANNTHVSTTGYLLLGDAIYKEIDR